MDPEDPTVIAETELLGAAASIEAAAKKLEQLKPRAKPKVSEPFPVQVFITKDCVKMKTSVKSVFKKKKKSRCVLLELIKLHAYSHTYEQYMYIYSVYILFSAC